MFCILETPVKVLVVVDVSTKATKIPAESPETAKVGFDVSPVEVLIRNSPLTSTALALLRDL